MPRSIAGKPTTFMEITAAGEDDGTRARLLDDAPVMLRRSELRAYEDLLREVELSVGILDGPAGGSSIERCEAMAARLCRRRFGGGG
mgnify:CR=1 FL=1